MLDKRYLTFSVFAKELSYTKTAQFLYITQPAVSQQLKSLETELGVTLIKKENSRLKLTPQGKMLAQYIQFSKIETQKILMQLKHYEEQLSLKIGSTLSLSPTLLPNFLQIFAPEFPEIQVKVANTEEILEEIRQGKVDCGFIEGNFNRKEFDAIFLKRDAFVAVTGNPKLLPNKGPQRVENLLTETLLLREKGSGSLNILENWLGTENITLDDFTHKIEIPNPSTIIQVLKSGLGFSFLYRSLVREELEKGTLKEILLEDLAVTHPIHFVFLKGSYFSQEYQTLVQKLMEKKNDGIN